MREKIEHIVQEMTANTHLYMVELIVKKHFVEVIIDGDCGINLNECSAINRAIHEGLEMEGIDTSDIVIDVASPGIEKVPETERDWKKTVGRKIQIKNHQGKLLKGTLSFLDANQLVLTSGGGYTVKTEVIKRENVKEVEIVVL